MTSSMRVRSPEPSASSARRICDSTRPPICSTLERIESRSRSYCFDACSLTPMMPTCLSRRSPESAGDVVLGLLHLRLDEQLVGDAELDHLAKVHVGGEIRHPCRLLHVVGDDHHRVVALQL